MNDTNSEGEDNVANPGFNGSPLYYRLFGVFVICLGFFSVYANRRSEDLVGDTIIGVSMLMFLLVYTAPLKSSRELSISFLFFWIILSLIHSFT
ncbi:hypothetical protein [Oceaniferula spumae]|uniref:hypothetical protein n=1 Tax=Oceaniferula spumae TaxID=2979115 RepID=UPI003F4EE1E7